MSPSDYITETLSGLQRALDETLRHDYSPERSSEFYQECQSRLAEIKKAVRATATTDTLGLALRLGEVEQLALWISLIERSHLGAFSWPFAEEIRRIATAFLSETTLGGDHLEPITHFVSEGGGYRIMNESQVPASSGKRRFVVVYFPPHLKHHVLLHSLFGHELGHTTFFTTDVSAAVTSAVARPLIHASPLADSAQLTKWLHDNDAPNEIKLYLQTYLNLYGSPYSFPDSSILSWQIEFICDLFGLMLFGPVFVAAHKTVLEASHPYPFWFNLEEATHPPYALRHKMLVQALKLLGWDNPVTSASSAVNAAEQELYSNITVDPFPTWSAIFPEADLSAALSGISSILSPKHLGYSPPDPALVTELVTCISNRVPPLHQELDIEGTPSFLETPMAHVLYSGWVYWFGKSTLHPTNALEFLYVNRLCEQALVQQTAINATVSAKEINP